MAGGEHRFGLGDVEHAPGVDDGAVGGRLHRAAQRRPLVVVVPAVRDVARVAPVVADVEAEVVDGALGRERGHRRRALVDAEAAVDHLVEAEPQARA